MAKARSSESIKFPFRYEANGRTGRIKYWPKAGVYGTYFRFAGKPFRNSFKTFEAACDYLALEFDRLDTDQANSLSQYPINHDIKTYHELEQLLRDQAGGATLREAVEFFLVHHRHKRFKSKSVKECIELFLQHERGRNLAPGHIETLEKHLNRCAGDHGMRKIHDFAAEEITAWIGRQVDERTGEKWATKTRINVRGSLASLSIHARDVLHAIPDLGKTEFQKVRNPKKDDRGEVEIYTPAAIETLLQVAVMRDIDLVPMIALGSWEGLRPDEIHAENTNRERLRWDAFVWHDSILNVKGQKVRSRATRPVPIFPVTAAWIEPFKGLEGDIWSPEKSYDKRMRALFKEAKLTRLYDGFRHSFASYRIRHLKGDLVALADEMGNSPEEIINSYKRNVTDREADAWFAVRPPSGYAKKVALALGLRHSP